MDLNEPRTTTVEAFVDALPYGARQPGGRERRELVRLVGLALEAGWTDTGLKGELERDLGGARSPIGVWLHRLKPENLQTPAASPGPAGNARPPWCGVCNERSRLVENDDDTSHHCRTCHPRYQAATTGVAA
jgi:hypothetical protein